MKTFEFTDEQIKIIAHALRTTIRVNQEAVNKMHEVCGCTKETEEIANRIIEGNICMKTLLNYIEQV